MGMNWNWNVVKEFVGLPGDQKFMAGELLIILTLSGIIVTQHYDGKSKDQQILKLTIQVATVKAEAATERVKMMQDRIRQLEYKERQLDSAIAVYNEVQQINYRTLKRYGK